MLLSIGMIVRNEEANLPKCLSALKPLLSSLDSELVIVDTGSTDKTIDIAKEYTNKIYSFEWINDFSAARNFCLSKCSGEWFMYLDADEVLNDASELIDFFKSGKYQNYVCAYHAKHEYLDDTYTSYNISYCCRIFKNEEIEFKNKIHEIIPEKEPSITLENTWYHHYGYVKEYESKIKRNEEIIQTILKDNPNDISALRYHFRNLEALKKYQEIINEYEGLKLDNPDYICLNQITQCAFSAYLHYDKVKKAEALINVIKNSDNDLLYMYSKLINYHLKSFDYLSLDIYLGYYLECRDKAIKQVNENHALDSYGSSFRDLAYLETIYKYLLNTMIMNHDFALFSSIMSKFHNYPSYQVFDLAKEYQYIAYMEDYFYEDNLGIGEGAWWNSYLFNRAINEGSLGFPCDINEKDIPYLVKNYNSIDYTSNVYSFIKNLDQDIENKNDILLIMYILENALELKTTDNKDQLLFIFNNLIEFSSYYISEYYESIEAIETDKLHFLLPYYVKIANELDEENASKILDACKNYNPKLGYLF